MARIDLNNPSRSGPPLSRVVAELAARQWGVVSRAQLRRLAVPGATVDYWVATRRLLVVHRGVYAPGHRALRAEG